MSIILGAKRERQHLKDINEQLSDYDVAEDVKNTGWAIDEDFIELSDENNNINSDENTPNI